MLDTQEVVQDIRAIHLFEDVSAAVLHELLPLLTSRRYQPGEFIFHLGDLATRLYFLHTGIVELSRVLPDGQDHIVDIVQPGNTFGELFLSRDKRRIATAQALTDVHVSTVHEVAFNRLVGRYPDLCRNFVRHLIDQRRRALTRLDVIMHAEAGPRLLFILLELAERTGRCTDSSYSVPEHVTQEVLARLAGLNRSTVSSMINEYRRAGILGGRGRTLLLYCRAAKATVAGAGLAGLI